MIRRHKKFGLFFFVVAVVLGLATAAGSFQGSPAHAQVNRNGTVSLTAAQTEVYEGGAVVVTLTRSGGPTDVAVPVQVRSWEDNRASGGNNPSNQIHDITIEPGQNTATLTFTAYVDGESETASDLLTVEIQSVGGGYQVGNPSSATVEINDPPSDSAIIELSTPSTTSVTEGNFVSYKLRRSGDLSGKLKVQVRYDDPHELLRGNHFDPLPYRYLDPEIEIGVGDDERNLTLRIPDDQRDLDGESQYFTLTVLPSDDYLLGNTGLSTGITWEVTDNDDAQELQICIGAYLDHRPAFSEHGDPGESYLRTCPNNHICLHTRTRRGDLLL